MISTDENNLLRVCMVLDLKNNIRVQQYSHKFLS